MAQWTWGLLAAVFASASVVTAGAPSSADQAAEPSPPASATSLPEIGRTRTTRPACAVLRDLVVPSVAAAQRGDARFGDTRPILANYVRKLDERNYTFGKMLLMQIERAQLSLTAQSLAIGKALGDPRVAATVTDPEVVRLRAALQELYAAQVTQSNALAIWTMKGRLDEGRRGISSDEGPVKRSEDPFKGGDPPPLFAPQAPSDLKGTLALSGDPLTDARRVDTFTGDLAAYAAAREANAARIYSAATSGCAAKL